MGKYQVGYILTGFTNIEANSPNEAEEKLESILKKEGISLNQYVLEVMEINEVEDF